MDEFIDDLLHKESIFEITLPSLPKRRILELNEDLKPRISVLEADLNFDNLMEETRDEQENLKLENDTELNIDNLNNYEESQSEDELNINNDFEEIIEMDENKTSIVNINDDRWKKYEDDENFVQKIDKFESFNTKKNIKYKGNLQDLSSDEDIRFTKKKKKQIADKEVINNKKRRIEDKKIEDEDLKKLDPNSDEYWLALRKKILQ